MIEYDDVTKENIKQSSYQPYRILIIGGSGTGKQKHHT